jgi:hypothetical protein
VEAKQDLELTIRTATLIKSLSQLVGTRDALVARMVLMESAEQFDALVDFVKTCQPSKRTG